MLEIRLFDFQLWDCGVRVGRYRSVGRVNVAVWRAFHLVHFEDAKLLDREGLQAAFNVGFTVQFPVFAPSTWCVAVIVGNVIDVFAALINCLQLELGLGGLAAGLLLLILLLLVIYLLQEINDLLHHGILLFVQHLPVPSVVSLKYLNVLFQHADLVLGVLQLVLDVRFRFLGRDEVSGTDLRVVHLLILQSYLLLHEQKIEGGASVVLLAFRMGNGIPAAAHVS